MAHSSSGDETETGDSTSRERRSGPSSFRVGDRIGRYVVERELGRGSEGVVLAAHDPELLRTVALKCIDADPHEGWPRARMIREARALARIDHPNVVKIFDVIEERAVLVLAMELIDGSDMRKWLIAAARPIDDVVALMVQAGQGIAAAHAAGLVHRDFKPANVLITSPGVHGEVRVVVTDFGLVREDPTRSGVSSNVLGEAFESAHGRARAGTPRYMAPEQIVGYEVDARSDQFSFCVTLFEACFGRHPFGADTRMAGPAGALAMRMRPVEPPAGTPSWLVRAVERGLAPDPQARFPTMAELLRALQPQRRSKWARLAIAAAGVSVLGVSGYLALHDRDARAPVAELAHDSIGTAFRRLPRRAELFRIAAEVDRGRYLDMVPRLETVAMAAEQDGDDRNAFSAAVLLVDLFALRLTRLEQADRWHAFAQASLARMAHPDPEMRARIAELGGMIAFQRGDDEGARAAFEAAVDLYPPEALPQILQAHANLGTTCARMGDLDAAREQLELAIELRNDDPQGTRDERVALAHDEANLAMLLGAMGEHAAGIELHEKALADVTEVLGSDHPEVAEQLVGLANMEIIMGYDDLAIEPLTRAIAIHSETRGANDPWVAHAQTLLAHAWLELGNHAAARLAASKAIAMAQGRSQAMIEADARIVLARTLWRDNRTLALREAHRALELLREAAATPKQMEGITEWLDGHE
jgi:tRNA A-37 threonylcarbamoyl transferase component Bud32/tetratricopeptide (TPR) repeat protein